MKKKEIIIRGRDDLERLYLYDRKVIMKNGRIIKFKKTSLPAVKDRMGEVKMRHLGRYGLILPFIQSGYRILDFPCGSGLAVEVFSRLKKFGDFFYEGRDLDEETIIYAKTVYGKDRPWVNFQVGDLTNFRLNPETYDIICCIEGVEHIRHKFQKRMVAEFFKGLKKGGIFIVSSPLPESGISGFNPSNPYHLYELTREDLLKILTRSFSEKDVEIITQEYLLTTGQISTCIYAFCHKK